jgi:hypothetical protein
MSGFKCLKAAEPVLMQTGKDAHPHPQMNKTCAQAAILGNCRVTIAEIAARLGINVTCPWAKPLV